MYGTEEGRVLVKATLKGNKMADETYEGFVAKQREILFRIQILKGKSGPVSKASADQAADHVKVANVYLRQIGARLTPDPDTKSTTDGAKLVDDKKPGFFTAIVDDALVSKVTDIIAEKTIKVNHRPKVVNICYIESRTDPLKIARAVNYPGNSNGGSLTLTYRVEVDDAPTKETLKLLPESIQAGDKEKKVIWGIIVQTIRANPSDKFANPIYGNALAHEVGHVMNLNHRPGTDGIAKPANANLMRGEAKFGPLATGIIISQDLDLIQCIGARGSKAFKD
jgi:hypothetical protein